MGGPQQSAVMSDAAALALIGAHDAVTKTIQTEAAAETRAEETVVPEEHGGQYHGLWKAIPNDPRRPGPKLAGQLKVRRYIGIKTSKEVVLGDLWKGRLAIVFLMPDIKSIACRDMLVAVALVQAHLEKLGVALCIIFPSKNPKHGNDVCEDFGIDVSHAEVYADVSNDQIVYQQMGLYKKTRETSGEPSSISKRLEAWGYYMLRAFWGSATNAICCVNGFGVGDNSKYHGGVIFLGPTDDAIRYRSYDEDGQRKVDTHTIMGKATRMALSFAQNATADVFVPV